MPLSKLALEYAHKKIDTSLILHADCLEWMGRIPEGSISGIVTDPPYGVKEYEFDQLEKRANGNGGIWRIPPTFDGCTRQPLPRFTALNQKERDQLSRFFTEWAKVAVHALKPGGHVFIACNSFLCQMVYSALVAGGLEFRGQLIRVVVHVLHNRFAVLGYPRGHHFANQATKVGLHHRVFQARHILGVKLRINRSHEVDEIAHGGVHMFCCNAKGNDCFRVETVFFRKLWENQFGHYAAKILHGAEK